MTRDPRQGHMARCSRWRMVARWRVVVGAVLLAAVTGTGGLLSRAPADAGSKVRPSNSPPPKPPRLPWVNADGSVDQKKRADTVMGVSGPDGKPVRNADGSEKTVRISDLNKGPEAPPAELPPDPPGVKRTLTPDGSGVVYENVPITRP